MNIISVYRSLRVLKAFSDPNSTLVCKILGYIYDMGNFINAKRLSKAAPALMVFEVAITLELIRALVLV